MNVKFSKSNEVDFMEHIPSVAFCRIGRYLVLRKIDRHMILRQSQSFQLRRDIHE